MTRLRCAIEGIHHASEHVRRIHLRPVAGRVPEFHAGQYLKIIHPSGHEIPYSIASPPEVRDRLELHYQPIAGSEDARLMDALMRGRELTLDLPFGDCFVDAPLERPLVIAAAATGYAQAKSVIEHVLEKGLSAALDLYWGVKTPPELYEHEYLRRLASTTALFRFHAVVQIPTRDWNGRAGTPASVIAEDFRDLSSTDVMLCGGPEMVHATLDALKRIGLHESNVRSDVFGYAPRA